MKSAKICLLAVASAGALAAVAAYAQTAADPMAGYYGNTFIIWRPSDPVRSETHTWIKADGTSTSINISEKDGHFQVRLSEGNWELQNGRYCRINKTRTPPTNSCDNPLDSGEPGHKVGDKWEGKTRDGRPEFFEIVAGQM